MPRTLSEETAASPGDGSIFFSRFAIWLSTTRSVMAVSSTPRRVDQHHGGSARGPAASQTVSTA